MATRPPWPPDFAGRQPRTSDLRQHRNANAANKTSTARRSNNTGTKTTRNARCESDRYHLLNLTHLARGRNRIEFRAFAGTLNKTKVIGYIQMCLGLVELALNTRRCSGLGLRQKGGHQELLGSTGCGPRRDGTESAVLPPRMDERLVQRRTSQQTIRRTLQRRTDLRLETGQNQTSRIGPEIRPGGIKANHLH